MLARYITLLRRAPKGMRQRHAFFWAVSITAVIALVWGVSLPSLMKPLPSGDPLAEAKEQTRPLGSLWAQARKQMASLMSAVTATSTEATDMGWIASSSDQSAVSAASSAPAIILSPEDIEKAQARANIVYRPTSTPATIATTSVPTPQVVLIATTTSATTGGGR